MIVLGIETSCDETSVAVVSDDAPKGQRILAQTIRSQIEDHQIYGGVVPEIAARAHLDALVPLIKRTLGEAELGFEALDGIAATCGPGLIGGVIVGMMTGKAIAAARGLPFLPVNHLEGHILTPVLTDDVPCPYLVLLVSGAHTQLVAVRGFADYCILGTTLDDAVGEAFDKGARLLGLGYPGGPHLERCAALCADPERARERFPLPRPMQGKAHLNFSFSGLKSALRRHVDQTGVLDDADRADLACAFQEAVAESLDDRVHRALTAFGEICGQAPQALVAAGGVAANRAIGKRLESRAAAFHVPFLAPPLELCSDNAAMIAWAGTMRLRRGLTGRLDHPARPRWSVESLNMSEISA